MFKHFKPKTSNSDSFLDDSDKCEVIDIVNDDGDNNQDENGHEEETNNKSVNENFSNPSQDKQKFKSDLCDFEAEREYVISNHKLADHRLHCAWGCPQVFTSRNQASKHMRQVHNANL